MKKILVLLIAITFFCINSNLAQAEETGCCAWQANSGQGYNGVPKCEDNLTKNQCFVFSSTDHRQNIDHFFVGKTCANNGCHGDLGDPFMAAPDDRDKTIDPTANQTQSTTKTKTLDPIRFNFNVPLPGFDQQLVVKATDSSTLADYIFWLYKFLVGVAGLLALFMVTIGAIVWLFANGDGGQISTGKNYITGAIIGLLLSMASYSILFIINPQTVLNKFPDISKVNETEIEDAYYNDPGEDVNYTYNKHAKTVTGLYCYKQGSKPWGQKVFGKKCSGPPTIAKSGCGPTSLAMILSAFKNQNITPDIIADKVDACGGRICKAGSSIAGLIHVAGEYGFVANTISWDNLSNCLSGGGYVIAQMHGPNKGKPEACARFTKNGHYVVIGAINAGRIEINDSANSKITGYGNCFRSEAPELVKKCSDALLCVKK
jgi:hypothetical protein